MKILLVINKPNREMVVMEYIRGEILSLDPAAQVKILPFIDYPPFNSAVFQYRPDVILTFPFTSVGFAFMYYIYKLFFNCKLVCLRSEGIVNTGKRVDVEWAIGYDTYGKTLVDHEIFWGKRNAEVLGAELLSQSKLSSPDRISYMGYPEVECLFKDDESSFGPPLPRRISDKLAAYPKERVAFFVTGFHLANYNRELFALAADIDMENHGDLFLEGVELAKEFRQGWIDNIISAARQNPEMLFVLKKHPIELRENYSALEGFPNILYVHEDVKVRRIIPSVGLFFHYGSTTLANAYLSGVPSVFVYSRREILWFSDILCPDGVKVPPEGIPQAIADFKAGKIKFELTDSIKKVLKDFYNIEIGKPYCPSREIAGLLLDGSPAQKIPVWDVYLWKALLLSAYRLGRRAAGRLAKRLLGMHPDAVFFSKEN